MDLLARTAEAMVGLSERVLREDSMVTGEHPGTIGVE